MNQVPSNEERIFQTARAITDEVSRDAYVLSACGDDGPLLGRIVALLRLDAEPASYLESPPIELAGTAAMPQLMEKPGDEIGPYKLLQQIGEGGFGVVYMAEQTRPIRRKVALKIIKPGMDTREVIARFEAERQALALMDHPNIAKVLDGGATNSGRPYFVMELVKGIPLTRFCDENRLDTRQRLGLFASVCKAIQHAHHKGVIHRDIKPSNVMITLHDSLPVPKVIDFGVSKAITQQFTEKTLFTAYGQMIGTPQYMSPEQAEMSGLDIDTRSDIYSLGVLLYELLTGSTPLDVKSLRGKAFTELQRMIREADPQKPSLRMSTVSEATISVAASRNTDPQKLGAILRGELDWIVLKALDKDRNRRYETANDFAHDVERYLRNESVLACPPTFVYRVSKTVRRHRTALLVAATLFLTLIGGLATSLWQYRDAVTQRKSAEVAKERALNSEKQSLDRLAQVERAEQIKDEALAAQSAALIRSDALRFTAESSAVLPTNPGLALLLAIKGAQRLPDLASANKALIAAMLNCREIRTFLHDGVGTEVQAVEINSDGTRVLGIEHSRIFAWDTDSGALIAKIDPQGRFQNIRAKFSPDGRHFAMYSSGYATDTDKNGVNRGFTDRVVRIWDSNTGLERQVLRGHTDRVSDVCYSRDGIKLLTASWDGTVRLWNSATGEEIKSFNYGSSANSAVFSPNEDRVLAIAENQSVSSTTGWDGEENIRPTIIDPPLSAPDFVDRPGVGVGSSNGYETDFTPNAHPIGICWDLASGEVVSTFKYKEKGSPVASAYLSNGKYVVIKFSNVITLWEVETGKLVFECSAQLQNEIAYPLAPDFGALSALFIDGKREEFLYIVPRADRHAAYEMLTGWPTDPKGLWAATGIGNQIAVTHNAMLSMNSFYLSGHEGKVKDVCFSRDGRRIFSAGDVSVRMWDVRNNEPHIYVDLNDLDDEQPFSKTETFRVQRGIRPGMNGMRVVWKANAVAFSPNGKQVATGSEDKSTRLWDANTGHRLAILKAKIESPETSVAPKKFNIPDVLDRLSNLFDSPPEPKPGDSMLGEVRLVRFSPDGKRLVTLSDDPYTTEKLGDQPDSPAKHLPFTPAKIWDSSTLELFSSCPGNVFDFSTSDNVGERPEYSTGFANAAFTPDSNHLVTSDALTDFSCEINADGFARVGSRSGMTFEKNGKLLGPFFGVKSWNANNGQLVKSIVSDIAGQLCYISDDGMRGLIPMQNGRIVVDPIVGSTICKLKEDSSGSSYCAQFSEDLKWLLTMEYPASRLWDLETGNLICQIESKLSPPLERHALSDNETNAKPQSNAIYPLLAKFGANSTRLITIYSDNSAYLWEIPSGAPIAALVGHTKNITCVDFSPDCKWVVTGSTDGTARVWNAENGREYVAFPHGEITAVAFAPDSQRIVTASAHGTSRIWPLDLLELAKSKAPRQLTAAERIRFEIESNERSIPTEEVSVDNDRKQR